jgi:hypothetical protein
MKFVLFVEGKTEQRAVPAFLKRWLDPRLIQPVGIKPVKFEGWAELVKDVPVKAKMYLTGPDVIAVVSLLDLYGPTIYPAHAATAADRIAWGKQRIEQVVGHAQFRHFFAVHEVEAWLLSDTSIFPAQVRNGLSGKVKQPETVNFDTPPAVLLDRLYTQASGRGYKKVAYGKDLFGKLDPETAYAKCPELKMLLDEMLALARQAGL